MIFVVWKKLMIRNRFFRIATKIFGTIILLLIFVLYLFRPILRFLRNPIERTLRLLLDMFGLKAVDDEE